MRAAQPRDEQGRNSREWLQAARDARGEYRQDQSPCMRLARRLPPVPGVPPPRHFELRVVVWKTAEVPAHDYIGDMNDLYVKVKPVPT